MFLPCKLSACVINEPDVREWNFDFWRGLMSRTDHVVGLDLRPFSSLVAWCSIMRITEKIHPRSIYAKQIHPTDLLRFSLFFTTCPNLIMLFCIISEAELNPKTSHLEQTWILNTSIINVVTRVAFVPIHPLKLWKWRRRVILTQGRPQDV